MIVYRCSHCSYEQVAISSIQTHIANMHSGRSMSDYITVDKPENSSLNLTMKQEISQEKYQLSPQDFLDLVEEFYNTKILPFAKAGQKEYAHKDSQALRNFNQLSVDLGIPRNKILWVFLKKHLDGILSYINGHRSQREPVSGRIGDAIVYLLLLQGMIQEDERNNMVIMDQLTTPKVK